jgi:hypothetical protein
MVQADANREYFKLPDPEANIYFWAISEDLFPFPVGGHALLSCRGQDLLRQDDVRGFCNQVSRLTKAYSSYS